MVRKFGQFKVKEGLVAQFLGEKLTLAKDGEESYLYCREHEGEKVADRIFSSNGGNVELAIYPIRPIMIPQQFAHHILIKLDPPITIAPNSDITHRLTMPIEIGVFTSNEVQNYLIDVFSLNAPKYALYGLPESGYICRLHTSHISTSDKAKQYETATVIMRFENHTQDWATISKIVMDAYMIDFYLKGDNVYLEDSNMVVENGAIASLYLNNKPPMPGLTEVPMATETVTKFRLSILERTGFGVTGKFVMEQGY